MKIKFLVAVMFSAMVAALFFIPEVVAFAIVMGILLEFIIRGEFFKEEES